VVLTQKVKKCSYGLLTKHGSMAMERLVNFSDEVTDGRKSARAEEERIERGGWTVNN